MHKVHLNSERQKEHGWGLYSFVLGLCICIMPSSFLGFVIPGYMDMWSTVLVPSLVLFPFCISNIYDIFGSLFSNERKKRVYPDRGDMGKE